MITPAGGGQSPEPGEQPDTEIAWDDVVDVICVGSDPGPVAHAIAAAGSGLRAVSYTLLTLPTNLPMRFVSLAVHVTKQLC